MVEKKTHHFKKPIRLSRKLVANHFAFSILILTVFIHHTLLVKLTTLGLFQQRRNVRAIFNLASS